MQIRRSTAYLGLLIGLVLLVWAGFVRYHVHAVAKDGVQTSEQSTSINGYSIVREAARDGVGRDEQGRLIRRDPKAKKDAETCYT